MSSPDADSEALQRSIYLEKVERARQMTVGERLASVFECSELGLEMMYAQIRSENEALSDQAIHLEAGARMDRLRKVRERGFFQAMVAQEH